MSPAAREAKVARKAMRRAVQTGVEAELFTLLSIFERDKWVCGICDEAVDSDLRYPHPQSRSLDHVVPISRGGPHTRANVRCSHLLCNVRRSNQLEGAAVGVSSTA